PYAAGDQDWLRQRHVVLLLIPAGLAWVCGFQGIIALSYLTRDGHYLQWMLPLGVLGLTFSITALLCAILVVKRGNRGLIAMLVLLVAGILCLANSSLVVLAEQNRAIERVAPARYQFPK